MELERLCELLGFKIERQSHISWRSTPIGYQTNLVLEGELSSEEHYADKLIKDKLEKILTDVVNANKEKKNENN